MGAAKGGRAGRPAGEVEQAIVANSTRDAHLRAAEG
jgi:hypothetical protein